jgi:quinol monooxygenase YgiN
VREEPGNLRFDAHQDIDDERKFVLLGRYVSAEAFRAHQGSEHFGRIFLDQIVPLLEERTIEGFAVPDEQT